jgi:hypothetical protein
VKREGPLFEVPEHVVCGPVENGVPVQPLGAPRNAGEFRLWFRYGRFGTIRTFLSADADSRQDGMTRKPLNQCPAYDRGLQFPKCRISSRPWTKAGSVSRNSVLRTAARCSPSASASDPGDPRSLSALRSTPNRAGRRVGGMPAMTGAIQPAQGHCGSAREGRGALDPPGSL